MKFEFSQHIFEKYSNRKFQENPTSGSRVVPCGRMDGRTDGWTDGRTGGRTDGRTDGRMDGRIDGRTDGYDEANSRFS